MAIYTKFGKQDTIYKFIRKLYENISNNEAHALATYKDKECFNLQCAARKLRSFDDILECVETYYPHVTPQYLMHILLTIDIRDKNKPLYLYMSNCSSIRRIRIYYHNAQYYDSINCAKYDSKWSWRELLKTLNLETAEDIRNYINKYKNETLQNNKF